MVFYLSPLYNGCTVDSFYQGGTNHAKIQHSLLLCTLVCAWRPRKSGDDGRRHLRRRLAHLGTIQDTGTLTHDGQMIDVCICITDTGADLYYDKAEQELYTTVQFPVPLDSAASRYQGTDYSDLDGDGNSDLQMSFDQDGEYVTYVWYWNTVRGEFMDTLAD